MTKEVIVSLRVEGFHRWPLAIEEVAFLRLRHRHEFHLRIGLFVDGSDREVEFFMTKRRIEDFLYTEFGRPCEFGTMSCEMIAETILDKFKGVAWAEVFEDGENGARVTR